MGHHDKRTFEVDPQLAEFDIPIHDFFSSKPEYTAFIIGAYIFSSGKGDEYYTPQSPATSTAKTETKADTSDNPALSHEAMGTTRPHALLLRRSLSDSLGGLWEGPGGSCDSTDATVLDSVAREVLEETGLHVSRIRKLVAVDQWNRDRGLASGPEKRGMAVKFSFAVDVHEANPKADIFNPDWEHNIKLTPGEHERYRWVTEVDIKRYLAGEDEIKLTFPSTAANYLQAFDVYNR
ncbi:NUDIX domain protein [Arthroderma uncinatum]|uniref:NUDIX domain protein n=1 Tax=Arthroderma uncinatum TaxID=74035 RepID=UPI00144A92B5|nr:NUDIX domain protein [Arthroderma uncinatum]KAF3480008.1 NUDIX domain protein [Arthroderma uncinatum]